MCIGSSSSLSPAFPLRSLWPSIALHLMCYLACLVPMLICSLQRVAVLSVTMPYIILKVVPSIALGPCFVNVWMIPIMSISLVFGSRLLADNCMQGGTLTALVWLRLGCGRPSKRRRSRVITNGVRRPLRQAILVGISQRTILVIRGGLLQTIS
jgi:hypothetical protein